MRLSPNAAEAWLGLLDNGDFASSWDGASSAFRATVTKDTWESVVLQYETAAGGNRRVIKTIVPNLDVDGQWRVGGYFIRPQ